MVTVAIATAILVGLWFAGHVAELGPFRGPLWTDAHDRSVGALRYTDATSPHESRGPDHCGWQRATFIAFQGGQYTNMRGLGSPRQLEVSFDSQATLPADAVFTGWRRGIRELWVSPSERQPSGPTGTGAHRNIYIVRGDRVERWPDWPLGCA